MATSINKQATRRQDGRFAVFSREEIDRKKSESVPINTKRANVKAARVFRAYLMECGDGTDPFDFENFSVAELNAALEGFWLGARNINGDKYRSSSLDNLRHGLSRYLRSPPNNKDYDIIKDREFGRSNEAFKAAMRELKEEGKGDTKHHPEIADADLKLMYSHFTDCRPMSPIQLQEKVQFDVRFYFFRRGAENMHKMNKNTFMLVTNPDTNQRYLRLAGDELTKNHQNTKESHTAAMPEMPNDARCPVSSYLKYLSHLHPECESLWTRPLPTTVNSPENKSWYSKAPIGKATLGRFMKDLSAKYMLSQIYTNHSIRVTGATILTRENFAASQIKAVTGHRSVTSLSIYQRVSDVEKIQMGETLGRRVGTAPAPSTCSKPPVSDNSTQPMPATPRSPLVTISSQELLEICHNMFEDEENNTSTGTTSSPPVASASLQPIDFNMSPFLRDTVSDPYFAAETETRTTTMTARNTGFHHATTTRQLCQSSPQPRDRPVFTGCTIGTIQNLVIHVHRK